MDFAYKLNKCIPSIHDIVSIFIHQKNTEPVFNFTGFSFENFFCGCFSVSMRMTVDYLTNVNEKTDRKKAH